MDKFFAKTERNDEKDCSRLSGGGKLQIPKPSSSTMIIVKIMKFGFISSESLLPYCLIWSTMLSNRQWCRVSLNDIMTKNHWN